MDMKQLRLRFRYYFLLAAGVHQHEDPEVLGNLCTPRTLRSQQTKQFSRSDNDGAAFDKVLDELCRFCGCRVKIIECPIAE